LLFGFLFELVSLDFNVDFLHFLELGVLEEEVQVGVDLWVGGGFYVVGSHLLLVFVEVSELFLHVLVFYSLFFHLYISLCYRYRIPIIGL
jgi:hypothetical protein